MTKHDMTSLTLVIIAGLCFIWCIFGSMFFLLIGLGAPFALLSFLSSLAAGIFLLVLFVGRETSDDEEGGDL